MANSQDVLFYVLASNNQLSREEFISKLINKINNQQRQVDIRIHSLTDCKRLEQAIWQYKPQSFITNSIALQTPCPIQLWDEKINKPCLDILLNLHPVFPELFNQYRRTIEILDQSTELISMGRERWKQYRAQGIEPTIYKIGKQL
jgi:DNA polymerase-3 subunit chi